jgi:hypothetical protein
LTTLSARSQKEKTRRLGPSGEYWSAAR